MSELKISAQVRTLTGNKVKQLRRDGLVPVVIYGQDREPVNAQVDSIELDRLVQAGGATQLVEVSMENSGMQNVLIREVQRHPVRRNPLHADFYAVNMRVKQQVRVPVISVGELTTAAAGMVLIQSLSDVEIEALPSDIPAHIEVDISVLDGEERDRITVADLPVLAGITFLDDSEESIFSLVASRTESEAEEDELDMLEEDVDVEPEVIGETDEEEDED
ncbi:MAG: 50S ribosomal protein L25 [Caldilineaceae bacterium]|nr:50S ribosomal protein L25 [Caldilineaceae bacterium]